MPTQEQLLSVIHTQTEIIKLGHDLNAVMTLIADKIQQITGAQGAVVELDEGEDMVYRAVSGGAAHLLGLRLARENSLSGLCIAENRILYCEDCENDPRVDRQACHRVGLRSMAVVPLIHAHEVVGILKIYSDQVAAFKLRDLKLLSLMSETFAAAMYHATKFDAQVLYKMATQDSLTGLANRALFLDCLRQRMSLAEQQQQSLNVCMLDMDRLKSINDQYGHRVGDAALKEIATRLKAILDDEVVIARLGGDEFALILDMNTDRNQALLTMQDISQACDAVFNFEEMSLQIGLSIGLAVYPEDGVEIETLLECADLRMYAQKHQRKHQGINKNHQVGLQA